MRHYYAIDWTYGVSTDGTGHRIGAYRRFEWASDRDEWVSDGNPDRRGRHHRSAIKSSDPELRQLLRREDVALDPTWWN